MNTVKDWGILVRTTRSELGLTQEQLASKLGVTFASVNRWENGRVTPSRLALKQIEALVNGMNAETRERFREYFV